MGCCENLAAIKTACSGGRGTAKDIVKAWIICEDDIVSIPDPDSDDHTISSDMELADGKVWNQIDLDPVGSSFSFDSQGEGQSQEYQNVGVLFIAGVSSDVNHILNSLIKGNPIVLLRDKNGNTWLFGAEGYGATVKLSAKNDRNGYTMTVTDNSPNLPYNYTGEIVTE